MKKNGSFIDDKEKMFDFLWLSKDEFLKSYPYIFEEEYAATEKAVKSTPNIKLPITNFNQDFDHAKVNREQRENLFAFATDKSNDLYDDIIAPHLNRFAIKANDDTYLQDENDTEWISATKNIAERYAQIQGEQSVFSEETIVVTAYDLAEHYVQDFQNRIAEIDLYKRGMKTSESVCLPYRIDGVNLNETLETIAQNNTFYHLHNDLSISIGQLERAAKTDGPMAKTLLWVSYPSGIDCYPEHQIFQKDTRGYNGVKFHATDMQSDRKLIYAVQVTGMKDGKIFGNLFTIDIKAYWERVKKEALESNYIKVFAKTDPKVFMMPREEFDQSYPHDLPRMIDWQHAPDNPAALSSLLDAVRKEREMGCTPKEAWLHISELHDSCIHFYANKIMQALGSVPAPNSENGQSFSVEFSIVNAFTSEQLCRLLEALPYEGVEFSMQKYQSNMNVVVPKDEIIRERGKQQVLPVTDKPDKEPEAIRLTSVGILRDLFRVYYKDETAEKFYVVVDYRGKRKWHTTGGPFGEPDSPLKDGTILDIVEDENVVSRERISRQEHEAVGMFENASQNEPAKKQPERQKKSVTGRIKENTTRLAEAKQSGTTIPGKKKSEQEL